MKQGYASHLFMLTTTTISATTLALSVIGHCGMCEAHRPSRRVADATAESSREKESRRCGRKIGPARETEAERALSREL